MTPQFLELETGSLFALFYPATARVKLRVLVVPPFAEELNKCRRLMALTASRLAADGCDVLIPDLFGTGDSDGDFSAATWETWIENIKEVEEWFSTHSTGADLACLAVRSGCLLFHDAFTSSSVFANARIVAWQPTLVGEQLLNQFLRIRVMAARLAGRTESLKDLKASFSGGQAVEVAGYEISSEMASQLSGSAINAKSFPAVGRLSVVEFAAEESASLTHPVTRFVDEMRAAGVNADGTVICCEQFWKTQEIAAPSAAITATTQLFHNAHPTPM